MGEFGENCGIIVLVPIFKRENLLTGKEKSNMTCTVSKSSQRTLLGAYQRSVMGERTEYRLEMDQESGRARFHIVVLRGEEWAAVDIGDDILSVLDLFSKIVEGGVFPYTLPEVAEDYRKNEEIYSEKSR